MDTAEFRSAGHRVVDRIADLLGGIEDETLFPDIRPAELAALFDEPLPREGTTTEALLDELEEKLLPYCAHVNHPGYMGLITPTPTPVGILGDLLASALNQNPGAYTIGPSAVEIERRTVRWLCDLIGYDARAWGNLTSGGTTANFIGLKLGRDRTTGDQAQHTGLRGEWAVYGSEECHVALDKSIDAIGVGRERFRKLPTDDGFRLRIDALEDAIAKDRAAGIRPLCIVAVAGTTNTGSVDPLAQLRAIADREGAWLHVDACYGGGMLLSNEHPGVLDGLELADSVAMDPHKWFYAPLDVGAVLVRDGEQLTRSFGMKPAYLTDEMDTEGDRYQFYVHGFEQSRRFRSLKVWLSFKRYGGTELGRWIDRNVAQAAHLHRLAEESPDFVPATRPTMSAVCLRYDVAGLDDETSGRLHRAVARRVEESGRFWISTTVLKGKSYFRVNPVNFRTRTEHLDELMRLLETECRRAHAELSGAAPAS